MKKTIRINFNFYFNDVTESIDFDFFLNKSDNRQIDTDRIAVIANPYARGPNNSSKNMSGCRC